MSSLIKCNHECLTYTDAAGNGCPVRLVAQIHDELLFEVNAQLCDVYVVAGKSLTCPSDPFLFRVHGAWAVIASSAQTLVAVQLVKQRGCIILMPNAKAHWIAASCCWLILK